ncbi:MAG: hypothetical protein AAF666_20235, partial [Pseudomonadota bacterium]
MPTAYQRLQCGLAAVALCALTFGVSGCQQGAGYSSADAEWQRLRGSGPFHVVNAAHHRAVVSARGNQVAIEPADGFCVAEDSIETSARSVFALIGDCVIDGPAAGKTNGRGGLDLPSSVPGIMTVSISGDKGFGRETNGAGSLSGLRAFLESPEGVSMLGRGGGANTVSVKEIREIDDALFVYVEDKDTGIVPILSSRFWRAFIELNDRLTVVTISGFRDRPLEKADLLEFLVGQVEKLEVANAVPINESGVMVAQGGTQRLSDLQPEFIVTVKPPVPTRRPDQTQAVTVVEATEPPAATTVASEDPLRTIALDDLETPAEAEETQVAVVNTARTIEPSPIASQQTTPAPQQTAATKPAVKKPAAKTTSAARPSSPRKSASSARSTAAPKTPVAAPSA